VARCANAWPLTPAADYVSSLEPSFRAQELSFATSAVAANIRLAVAARERTWRQQLLGRQPQGAGGALSSAQERARAHAERHSFWLHNSVRGATALGLAVLVADLTGVQHSFWVVLGTLTVLRSTALSTGQNVLRGLAGNVAGVIIGGALILGIGSSENGKGGAFVRIRVHRDAGHPRIAAGPDHPQRDLAAVGDQHPLELAGPGRAHGGSAGPGGPARPGGSAARASTARAIRTCTSSTICPPTTPTPSAPAATTARACATSSGVGVNTWWASPICRG
jgi:hypothetical protein